MTNLSNNTFQPLPGISMSGRKSGKSLTVVTTIISKNYPYPPKCFFKVELIAGDRYRVTFYQDGEKEKEIKRWFRERGHQARYEKGDYFGPLYVKCSRDIALLAKLTFGGV